MAQLKKGTTIKLINIKSRLVVSDNRLKPVPTREEILFIIESVDDESKRYKCTCIGAGKTYNGKKTFWITAKELATKSYEIISEPEKVVNISFPLIHQLKE